MDYSTFNLMTGDLYGVLGEPTSKDNSSIIALYWISAGGRDSLYIAGNKLIDEPSPEYDEALLTVIPMAARRVAIEVMVKFAGRKPTDHTKNFSSDDLKNIIDNGNQLLRSGLKNNFSVIQTAKSNPNKGVLSQKIPRDRNGRILVGGAFVKVHSDNRVSIGVVDDILGDKIVILFDHGDQPKKYESFSSDKISIITSKSRSISAHELFCDEQEIAHYLRINKKLIGELAADGGVKIQRYDGYSIVARSAHETHQPMYQILNSNGHSMGIHSSKATLQFEDLIAADKLSRMLPEW